MFNPVLRKRGTHRLVYSTSIGFRLLSILTAGVIIVIVASVGEGSFFECINFVVLVIVGTCLFAALYLERWIFDKKANLFERNIGIVLFHSRRRILSWGGAETLSISTVLEHAWTAGRLIVIRRRS